MRDRKIYSLLLHLIIMLLVSRSICWFVPAPVAQLFLQLSSFIYML